LEYLGHFSFPKDLYAVFQYLGSFISGEDSLLYQWAEFTSNASKGTLKTEFVIEKLRTFPQTERDVQDARTLYDKILQENGSLECVWSGKAIKSSQSLNIDHVIPFTVWRNNDLWNLLPTSSVINAKKRDRIPNPPLIEKRREIISHYWDLLENEFNQRFHREMKISLLGKDNLNDNWHDIAIERLTEKCEYLINIRGFEGWSV
jgi:CRISPR/Cas system Type II protein with McrA/HNH and RuvC-like nuclease domain